MKKISSLIFAVVLFLMVNLFAIVPQDWKLQNIEDYLEGKFFGIALDSKGVLSLAPKEEAIKGPAQDFYLSLLVDSSGIMFLGTGHSGEVFKINKEGEAELYFKCPEMDIYCLAQDSKGILYAGSSPNGKVYKITDKGEFEEFFNPQEKYIWDLKFDPKGILLAAVGENGGIYAINQKGEGTQLLKTEENHILCMHLDGKNNIIAGSGGTGRIYRLSEGKSPRILFDSPYNEIKSIDLDKHGYIYAAAAGDVTVQAKTASELKDKQITTGVSIVVSASSSESTESAASSSAQKRSGALFRIDSEGIAEKLWESDKDLVYSVLWDEKEEHLFFGTGDRGRILTWNKDEKITLLFQKKSEQIYHLIPSNKHIYVLANNPAELTMLTPYQGFEGEYISQVFNAKILSSWGRIEWDAVLPEGTTLQLFTRSGNSNEPSQSWSEWSPPYQNNKGEQILSPKARFLQFKAMFKSQSGRISPELSRVSLFYLQTNLPPKITDLQIFSPNVVFIKPPVQEEQVFGKHNDNDEKTDKNSQSSALAMAKKTERKGFQTIVWGAEDENEDDLIFSVYIRNSQEERWRLLQENLLDKIYAFDTVTMPDGIYFLKVKAGDELSNPGGIALSDEKSSKPIVIDNSLPVIKQFQAVKNGNKLSASFLTEDSFSRIKEVKYLIRPDIWRVIFPVDGICDSDQEKFEFTLNLMPKSDDLITVKVMDEQGNVGVYRSVF
ncbi:MAG: hypothetical protein JW755_12170 [Candidatus Aminicenantes bacterium]|nr:hypothetical protein [Candidatus Aminicenantes bacterium]